MAATLDNRPPMDYLYGSNHQQQPKGVSNMRTITRLFALCVGLLFAGFAFAADSSNACPAFVADGPGVYAPAGVSTQPDAVEGVAMRMATDDGPAGIDTSESLHAFTNSQTAERYAADAFATWRSTGLAAAGMNAKHLRIRPGWRTEHRRV